MNDFYEGRMIPLKIADQAIINCNKEIEKLQIENDCLKALTVEMDKTINISQLGCRELKAEVERLEKHDDDTCRHYIMRLLLESQNTFLNARVERLTKAGDAMEVLIVGELAFYEDDGSQYDEVKAWNAAKEGNQSK